jgi:hypothetical protein
MAKEHKRQTVSTRDGTLIHIEWTRTEKFAAVMVPGETFYKATCEEHGKIAESYEGLTVGFDADDHGRDQHGGVLAQVELVDLTPAEERSS